MKIFTLLVVVLGTPTLMSCSHGGLGDAQRAVAESSVPTSPLDGSLSLVEVFGPGDVFELKVLNEAELSGKFRVSSAGEVSIPLVGRVQVSKMTLAEVEMPLLLP